MASKPRMTNHPRLVASRRFFLRGGGSDPTPPTYPTPPALTLVQSTANAEQKTTENAAAKSAEIAANVQHFWRILRLHSRQTS